MKLSLQIKGITLGAVAGLAAVGIAFAAGELIRPRPNTPSGAQESLTIPTEGTPARAIASPAGAMVERQGDSGQAQR